MHTNNVTPQVFSKNVFNFNNLLWFFLCSQPLLGLEHHICDFPCTSQSNLWYKTYGHTFGTISCTSKSTQKPTQSNDGYLPLFNHLSWFLWRLQINLAIKSNLQIPNPKKKKKKLGWLLNFMFLHDLINIFGVGDLMHVYHLESELLKMVYDLSAMLCLKGVPNIIVNDLVERWILIMCTFSMLKFIKTTCQQLMCS